jgi:hypothetical protein
LSQARRCRGAIEQASLELGARTIIGHLTEDKISHLASPRIPHLVMRRIGVAALAI